MFARRIIVKAGRLVCDIRLSPDCPRHSTSALMCVLQRDHPQLSFHPCKNERGAFFGAVMDETSIIHVFEHVAIDCMVQDSIQEKIDAKQLFVGNSQWIDRKAGEGRVELSFHDDICALRAVKRALRQMNEALMLARGE